MVQKKAVNLEASTAEPTADEKAAMTVEKMDEKTGD